MNGYLLDTNVISEYSRARPPDARVRRWVDAQMEESLYLSGLTLGEIRKGATLLPAGDKRQRLEMWLETGLPKWFASRLLPIDGQVAEIWGAMAGQAQLTGSHSRLSMGSLRRRPCTIT
jgi:toxin FitB